MAEHVKFVSYDGKWPNLCSGTLVLNIDSKDYSFGYSYGKEKEPDFDCKFWYSGGEVTADKDWNFTITHNPWVIVKKWIPEQFQKYAEEIEEEFNNNVEFGCCGGCS